MKLKELLLDPTVIVPIALIGLLVVGLMTGVVTVAESPPRVTLPADGYVWSESLQKWVPTERFTDSDLPKNTVWKPDRQPGLPAR